MFDIHQSIFTEDGDWDEELTYEYREGLIEAFAESPEGQQYMEANGSVGWSASLLDFLFDYLGTPLPEMSLGQFHEILYELFPRKVSVEPEAAGDIIEELRAFWRFIERQYAWPRANQFLEDLDAEAERKLRHELSDPDNFGMAKSFVMMGQQLGFDMTTQEGMQEFVGAYNSFMSAGRIAGDAAGGTRSPVSAQQRRATRKARNKQLKKRNRRR